MDLLKIGQNNIAINSIETACANCWGKQEYDNCYLELAADQSRRKIRYTSNLRRNFVMQFVETYITGIGRKNN